MKIRTFILSAALLMSALWILPVNPVQAWQTDQSASSYCSDENHAVIGWSFTNTESDGDGNSMDVVVKDNQTGTTSDKVTVPAGDTATGILNSGETVLGEGTLTYSLTWTDGRDGVDSRTSAYDATECIQDPEPIEVCRDGVVITIHPDERLDSDTEVPCPEIIPPTEVLPSTGLGGLIAGMFGITGVGTGIGSWMKSRRALKSGLLG